MFPTNPRTSLFSSVETLLQMFERQELPLEQQRHLTRQALRALNPLARHTQISAERLRIARYMYRFAAASEQWTFITEDVAESFAWAASLLFEQEAPAAELLLRRALVIWERLYGPANERVLTARHNLAALAEKRGDYDEAENLLHQVIMSRTNARASNQRETAVSLHNLARLYALQEKRAEAEVLYRRALALAEQAWGEEHPFTVTVLYNLALLYAQWLTLSVNWQTDQEDRMAEAETLLRRVYTHWQRTPGTDDLAATRILHQLALIFVSQEKWTEAEAAYQRVLANYARLLEADDLALATCLDQLMLCLQQRGKVAEAIEAARQALELRERVLGALHPDLAPTLSSLATLSIWLERFAEAEDLLLRAQNICLQAFGESHPSLVLVLNTRLLLRVRAGKLTEAAALLHQMTTLFAGIFGADAAETQAIRTQYETALAESGEHQSWPNT